MKALDNPFASANEVSCPETLASFASEPLVDTFSSAVSKYVKLFVLSFIRIYKLPLKYGRNCMDYFIN
jgi:hypothetical protein